MPEKEKEGKKRIERGEETKQNKPSLWSRIKKPLLTGVMTAGLLIAPVKKAEGVGFRNIRAPPIYMESVIEKDKDLRTGWKSIRKIYDDLTGKEIIDDNLAKSHLKYVINHYKKVYEKTGKVGAFYLSAYGEYLNSQYDPTLEGTEKICLEVVKEMDKI
ncbi:MAG: hypothetical protein NZ903_02605, partial [Candidatus Micrarchaeota archaeon]|nr:hypothetical protein [Candidatus Micrarchaeota archaeon]